ncbi:suppressor of profilin/p41 of actin-related complex 2/3 [Aphelenchoides avenae]|nr:suppressor of profilin/p41 of actin-related complex 2/3 [Aphelenchus avenae]
MVAARSPVQNWNLGIGPIQCHAWNKDRTQLAVSSTSPAVHIFELQRDSSWKEIHTLTEHDLPVTGIDWAPNTNRIVTCSMDKNAFVWTYTNGLWKPELVIVRSNRAATSVKWSPMENKFAVATGAKLVSVCYYERENDWWVSKQIKKPILSTVTSLNWHPGNVLLAVGACDFKTRVYSAYVKEIDDKPAPNPWGSKMPFGQLMAEYPTTGWVHSVAFSPSGCRLAWVAHDSTISVVDKNEGWTEPFVLRTTSLPYTSLHWADENNVIAAGHDCSPVVYALQNGKLTVVAKLDVPPENKSENVNSAFQKFRNFDRKASDTVSGVQLKTIHQNAIKEVQTFAGRVDSVSKFTTCGVDGQVVLWDLQNRVASA